MKDPKESKKIKTFVIIRTLANAFVMAGVVLSALLFWPFIKAEVGYDAAQIGKGYSLSPSDQIPKSGFGTLIKSGPPVGVEPINKDFSIIIEKIGVNAPVVPDVDSSNYNDYMNALRIGAAHAVGTAYPGTKNQDNNNVFIFAHSTLNFWDVPKYNAIFILLRKLETGDRITTFYKGTRYDYIVSDKKVVEANDVRYLTEPSKEPILTLQTCDPPGTNLRRLIITAKLVEYQ